MVTPGIGVLVMPGVVMPGVGVDVTIEPVGIVVGSVAGMVVPPAPMISAFDGITIVTGWFTEVTVSVIVIFVLLANSTRTSLRTM